MRNDSLDNTAAFVGCLIWIFVGIFWIMNLIELFNCDFETPFKEEVIHLIGVFIPPLSVITFWF